MGDQEQRGWNAADMLLRIGLLALVGGGIVAFSSPSSPVALPVVLIGATLMITGALLDVADAIRERRS